MIWFGIICLNFLWKEMTQAYPVPASIAVLSSQSMSTPSKLFSLTKVPSFIAQSTGSRFWVVGNYVAPNALIITFFPAALYLAFRFFWIPSLVVPNGLSLLKYFNGSTHILTISKAPVWQLQKANIM